MRIDRLKIHKYKNLVNCEFDFSNSDGLLVVAGINGSGKSNLLEAILLIMKDVFSIPKPVNVDWPLYEISFAGKNEVLSASRYSIECNSPRVVREPINGAGEVVHEQPSVVYMYSGEFNRIYNSRLGNVSEDELSSGFYSITAEDLNVATIVLAIRNQSGALREAESFLSLPDVSAVTFHSDGVVPVDGESGPVNELEDLSLWLSQQADDDGKIYVHIGSLSDKLAQLGVVNSRDQYYVLYQMLAENGVYGLSIIDIELELSLGQRMSIEDLSEGEKHLLLLRFAYEVLGVENSLILVDEPDAHMHEGRKIDLYTYLKDRSIGSSMTICTSHSSSFLNRIAANSLIGLKRDAGAEISVLTNNELDILATVHDDRMMLFSRKPLLLFEGKSDINLFLKAVRAFKAERKGYENISIEYDFDFASIGGTGDAKFIYGKFRRMFPRRVIYMVFDNDDSGRSALEKVTTDDDSDTTFQKLPKLNSPTSAVQGIGGAFLLPKPNRRYSATNNTIEDYMSGAYIRVEVRKAIKSFKSYHAIVDIKKAIKKHICDELKQFNARELGGFKSLIDFIRRLPLC